MMRTRALIHISPHAFQIGVARAQREFGRESTVGFLVTRRETAFGTNTVAGFDFRWKLTSHWVLTGQAVRYPGADGAVATSIILAAYRSSETACRVTVPDPL